ncbi:MAG: thioredoxin family protein [Dehalococcoidales bacterium]
MDIKILGPGCHKCHELDKRTREVIKELGLDVNVEYVQEITKLVEYSILFPPGLIINDNLISSGKLLSKKEIKDIIVSAMNQEEEPAA